MFPFLFFRQLRAEVGQSLFNENVVKIRMLNRSAYLTECLVRMNNYAPHKARPAWRYAHLFIYELYIVTTLAAPRPSRRVQCFNLSLSVFHRYMDHYTNDGDALYHSTKDS